MMNLNKSDFYNKILEKRKILNLWIGNNYIAEENDLDDLYKTWVFETKKAIVKDH